MSSPECTPASASVQPDDLIIQPSSPHLVEDDVTLIVDPTAGPMAWWTPLDRKSEANVALIMKALNAADTTVAKEIGNEFFLKSLLIQPVQAVDRETGELKPCRRLVFFTADGKTISTCSDGIYNSVRAIVSMKTAGPWDPPLHVRFRQVEARNNRRVFVMDYIVSPDDVLTVVNNKETHRAQNRRC